jgi:hypothetical protein
LPQNFCHRRFVYRYSRRIHLRCHAHERGYTVGT